MPKLMPQLIGALRFTAKVVRVTYLYEYLFFLSIVVILLLVVFAHTLGIPKLVAAFLFTILPVQIGLVWFFVDQIRERAAR